jgi:hypothetical protein
MPILQGPLDAQGHANVQLAFYLSPARVRVMQQAGQRLPQPVAATGTLDSGATFTVIDPAIRQALGIPPFRVQRFSVPSDPTPIRAFCYKIELIVLHPSGLQSSLVLPNLTVIETPLTHTGTDVLVGCDVLRQCSFTHHGLAGSFSLSY